MIEICGAAESISDASAKFKRYAQPITSVLAVGANAIVEQPPELELIYDVTPDKKEHEFFQRFLPKLPPQIMQGRIANPSALVPLFEAFGKHARADRLYQAATHYSVALNYWQPGYDLLALNHIWIGIETLTPPFLKWQCEQLGVEVDGLYELWQLPETTNGGEKRSLLDAEIRKRLIFSGDEHCYRTTKKASDGFEHGFLSLKEAHSLARQAKTDAAGYLRAAIFNLAMLKSSERELLLGSPFDRPLERWPLDFQLTGTLVGSTDQLGPSDSEHPHFKWNEGNVTATQAEGEKIILQVRDQALTASFGEGVIFHPQKFEVYGPKPEPGVIYETVKQKT